MSMSNDEKLRLAELMEGVCEKCEISFDGNLFTSKSLKSLIDVNLGLGETKLDHVISFVCSDIIDFVDVGLTVLIDGFSANSAKMYGKDCREMVARTMAYMACAKVVTTQPMVDLSNVIRRIDFTYLINQLMDYEQYPLLIDKCSKCNVLIISNINIPALLSMTKDKDKQSVNEAKALKIRVFFEEVISRRMTSKRLTLLTVQSKYDVLNNNRMCFGEKLQYMIEALDGRQNMVDAGFIKQNGACRIYIPGTKQDAESIGIRRSAVEQEGLFKEQMIRSSVDASVANKVIKAVSEACIQYDCRKEVVFDNLRQDLIRFVSNKKTRDRVADLMKFYMSNVDFITVLRGE